MEQTTGLVYSGAGRCSLWAREAQHLMRSAGLLEVWFLNPAERAVYSDKLSRVLIEHKH